MVLTFELSEPAALAAGCGLVDFSIYSGPKLALTVHKFRPEASAYGSQSECHLASDLRLILLGGNALNQQPRFLRGVIDPES